MQRPKPSRKKGQPGPSTSDVKLPKIAKIKMPDDFKIRTQPLFSLPEEVLKLPPPKNKAARIQASKSVPRRRSSGIMNIFFCKERNDFKNKNNFR